MESAGGVVNLTVRLLAARKYADGAQATTGASPAGMMLTRVALRTTGTGLATAGAGAFMRVGSSEITGNGTGVSASGVVFSTETNQLNQNGTDGTLTPIPPPALK